MNNQNAKSDNIFELENVSCFPCLKDLLGLFYGAEMQQKNDFRQNYRLRLTIFDEQNCLKIVKIRFFCIPSKLKSRNLSQNTYHGSYCYNQHIKECFRIYCWWNSTHDITATLYTSKYQIPFSITYLLNILVIICSCNPPTIQITVGLCNKSSVITLIW